jgi:hypothetical protein
MPEKVTVITAGSRETYEFVKSEDGLLITIRMANDNSKSFTFASSALGTIISALVQFKNDR